MPDFIPIADGNGILTGGVDIDVLYTTPGSKISTIEKITFTPNDLTVPYTISFYILYQSGDAPRLIYKKQLSAGVSIVDDTTYRLSDTMKLGAKVNVANLVEYSVNGKEQTLTP